MSRIPLILIVGPTAVGKTKLSVDLAKNFDGEIISGDSIQVYRGMDIGSAKVKEEEQEGVPHHLIDILDPDKPFSVADFQQLAKKKIHDIHARGHLPFIVGGTGLYVQSVTHNYHFSEVTGDAAVRNQLAQFAEEKGNDALYEELVQLDPEAAEKIHPNNTRRVIRALEVIKSSDTPFSAGRVHAENQSDYFPIWVGLTMDRELLYKRINLRVDIMMNEGLIEEVEQLLQKGYGERLQSMTAIGYKEIIMYLKGELSKEEATELLKRNTRRFAKRQLTWFNRIEAMKWFDMTDRELEKQRYEEISSYIAGKLLDHEEYGKD